MAIALIQGVLFLTLGLATGAATVSGPVDIVLVLIAMTLIAIALTGLGFAIAWRMDSTQGFHAIMSVFLLPMWLLSGAFFRRGAEGWLGLVVTANPLTYGVAALRYRLEAGDTSGLPPEPLCWAITIGFAAAMLAASWWVVTRKKA
jgi:ABC-2 type transport system permease protein